MTLEFDRIPFVEALGMQLLRYGSGEAEVTVPPRPTW